MRGPMRSWLERTRSPTASYFPAVTPTLSQCKKRRLADEYDAAQERGEIAKATDSLKIGPVIPKDNNGKARASDIGLSATEIHEARQIRDAEESDPGGMHRTVEDIIEIGRDLIAVIIALTRLSAFADPKWCSIMLTRAQMNMYGGKSFAATDLTAMALYELAAPSTPSEIRDAIANLRAIKKSSKKNEAESAFATLIVEGLFPSIKNERKT